jgi:hypothetical protein
MWRYACLTLRAFDRPFAKPEDIAGAEILVRAAAEKSSIKIVVNHLNTEKRAKFTANVEVFRGEFLHGVDDIPPGEPSAL